MSSFRIRKFPRLGAGGKGVHIVRQLVMAAEGATGYGSSAGLGAGSQRLGQPLAVEQIVKAITSYAPSPRPLPAATQRSREGPTETCHAHPSVSN